MYVNPKRNTQKIYIIKTQSSIPFPWTSVVTMYWPGAKFAVIFANCFFTFFALVYCKPANRGFEHQLLPPRPGSHSKYHQPNQYLLFSRSHHSYFHYASHLVMSRPLISIHVFETKREYAKISLSSRLKAPSHSSKLK